jgi:hypothetical protein
LLAATRRAHHLLGVAVARQVLHAGVRRELGQLIGLGVRLDVEVVVQLGAHRLDDRDLGP